MSPVLWRLLDQPHVLWGTLPHRRSVVLSGEWWGDRKRNTWAKSTFERLVKLTSVQWFWNRLMCLQWKVLLQKYKTAIRTGCWTRLLLLIIFNNYDVDIYTIWTPSYELVDAIGASCFYFAFYVRFASVWPQLKSEAIKLRNVSHIKKNHRTFLSALLSGWFRRSCGVPRHGIWRRIVRQRMRITALAHRLHEHSLTQELDHR